MFLNSPCREAPKNVIKKKSRKSRFWIFGRIFCRNFSTRFFLQNVFCSVFELPSLRNTRKRDKTKKVEEKLTSNFLSKYFSTWAFCKHIFMVFLNSPCRETPKNVLKKKSQKKKSQGVGRWVWDLVTVRGGPSIFVLAAPRGLSYFASP